MEDNEFAQQKREVGCEAVGKWGWYITKVRKKYFDIIRRLKVDNGEFALIYYNTQ